MSAPDDEPGGGDEAVGALAARQTGVLLDSIDRDFRGPAENRKHGPVLEEINGVVAPLAGGDLAAIKVENAVELASAEGHAARGDTGRAGAVAPLEFAWFDVAGHRWRLLCW